MKCVSMLIAGLVLVVSEPGLAVTRTGTGPGGKMNPMLEVAGGPAARGSVQIRWNRAPSGAAAAWKDFVTRAGGRWQAMWDVDTGVPLRIMGTGVAMPGSVDSPERAARYARAFLARHIDLLAPGARAVDFEVVSNRLDRGMRTIGMIQRHAGMIVLGGQVSFRFKNDRLFVIGSEALPRVNAPAATGSLTPERAHAGALAWMRQRAAGLQVVEPAILAGPFVLPVVSPARVAYHTVYRVTLTARSPLGRWHVFVDARTGEPVARQQQLRFAQGTIRYHVPQRYPDAGYVYWPAKNASLTIDGAQSQSDENGVVTWPLDMAVAVTTSASGPLVRVVNAIGNNATDSFTLAPDGALDWDTSTDEYASAQLSAFVHVGVVKDYARRFAPNLGYLDQEIIATVNIDNLCNAFYDGDTLNFYAGSAGCENTALLPDVVYHEFGHALHDNAIIPGVGAFDGAFSEGLADYLAASITGDPAVGRGFFHNEAPLRHIDPDDREARWPEDISEIHFTGLIFAGAMWDLRKALISAHGAEVGVEVAERLFYAAVQRAVNIPSSYVEVLAADDDDGNLDNGTPNECLINRAFGSLHGLRDMTLDHVTLGAQSPALAGHDISAQLIGTTARCPGDTIASATLHWGLRDDSAAPGQPEVLANQVALDVAGTTLSGTIPGQANGSVVRYRIEVELADGGVWAFPRNLADPAYEMYVGDLVELYCTDFETDVFASEGWNHQILDGDPGQYEWEWGQPGGIALDAATAFSGSGVIGTNLGKDSQDGIYGNNRQSLAQTPVIDVGDYSDVRLHYRRWLTVEDALYDHATIYANGTPRWRNIETSSGETHHMDTEWVFHDVPLSTGIKDGTLQVTFELETDQGLEFGGWNIDNVCVVANPRSICGDGVISGAETCDQGSGNHDSAQDACRTNCRVAGCGDGVVDTGEACDDGNRQDDDSCTSSCEIGPGADEGCGCTVGRARPRGAGLVLLFLAGIWLARRRARSVSM